MKSINNYKKNRIKLKLYKNKNKFRMPLLVLF